LRIFAEDLKKNPEMLKFFQENSPTNIWKYLQEKKNDEIPSNFHEILRFYGHRGDFEFELFSNVWSENPIPLISSLKNLLKMQGNHAEKPIENISSVWKTLLTPDEISKIEKLNVFQRTLFFFCLKKSRKSVQLRENAKNLLIKMASYFREFYKILGNSMKNEGYLRNPQQLFFLSHFEIETLLKFPHQARDSYLRLADSRMKFYPRIQHIQFPIFCKQDFDPLLEEKKKEEKKISSKDEKQTFKGQIVSVGIIEGPAKVLLSVEEANDEIVSGDILITHSTDIAWTPFFAVIGGVVTEIGGMISHGATVAREHGIPCIVNIPGICQEISTGDFIRLDANQGIITILKKAEKKNSNELKINI